MSPTTWEISDIDGSNRRRVTLEEFKAFNARKREEAMEIFRASVAAIGVSK